MIFFRLCILFLAFQASASFPPVPAPAPAPEPSEKNAPPDAVAFLESQGIESYGDIIYYKRSDNVSACLQHADARVRLIQMCAGRALVEQCGDSTTSYRFDSCQGQECRTQFSPEYTFCLLEKSGSMLQLNTSLGRWMCPDPPKDVPLFDWESPPWVQAIGDVNNFECLSAMPPNTSLHRRVVCEGDRPVLQFHATSGSKAFIGRNGRSVRCLATQWCGLPTIFAGEVICYEFIEPDLDDSLPDLSESISDLDVSFQDVNFSETISVSARMVALSFILSFLYMCV